MGLLQLHFADVDHPVWFERQMRMGLAVFDEEHANKILDFVNKMWDEVELIVIHCEAGASRSPAIAAAITKIKGGDDSEWFRTKIPNAYVYRKLLEVAHQRGEFGPIEEDKIPDPTGKFNNF